MSISQEPAAPQERAAEPERGPIAEQPVVAYAALLRAVERVLKGKTEASKSSFSGPAWAYVVREVIVTIRFCLLLLFMSGSILLGMFLTPQSEELARQLIAHVLRILPFV